MIEPHGGKLIDRYARKPAGAARAWPVIDLSEVAASDLYNIADGVFSPLEGFMTRRQFEGVCRNDRLDRVVWTVPILLDVDETAAGGLRRGGRAWLRTGGRTVGWIEIADIFRHDKKLHSLRVFGTSDRRHPGVNFVHEMKPWLVGGRISVFRRQARLNDYMTPAVTRALFRRMGLKTIAGFQTRNVLHRAHEYLHRCALELVDGLFLQPIVGWKKRGDFTAAAVVKAYREFIKDYYPASRAVLGTLKTAMRYAGPKEAVFHAIIRKNFGCSHFIVGRDHAGVGGYYGKYAAHEIFERVGDLGITILKFKEPLYCSKCDLIVTEKTCGHGARYHQEISGTLVRSIISRGEQPKHKIFRPEVYSLLEKEFKANKLFYD